MSAKQQVGSIGWLDLTVDDASGVRDFYQGVVGWSHTPVSMGDYNDFCMNRPGDGETVSGICHARGGNGELPAVWLPYFIVADLDASLAACEAGGGTLVSGPKSMGGDRYAIITDPAGASCALYQPAATDKD